MEHLKEPFKSRNLYKNKKKNKVFNSSGGGIRNEKTVNNLLENNIDRIVLGTLAVDQPDLINRYVKNTQIRLLLD